MTGIPTPVRNTIYDPESIKCSSQILSKSIRVPILTSRPYLPPYKPLTGGSLKNLMYLRFGDLKNHPYFEFCMIFHTKVLKDGPTPEIGAMRVEDLWVGNTCANKETGSSGPLSMRNQASEKKRGSNVAADFCLQ